MESDTLKPDVGPLAGSRVADRPGGRAETIGFLAERSRRSAPAHERFPRRERSPPSGYRDDRICETERSSGGDAPGSLLGDTASPALPNAGDIPTGAFWESARADVAIAATSAVGPGRVLTLGITRVGYSSRTTYAAIGPPDQPCRRCDREYAVCASGSALLVSCPGPLQRREGAFACLEPQTWIGGAKCIAHSRESTRGRNPMTRLQRRCPGRFS